MSESNELLVKFFLGSELNRPSLWPLQWGLKRPPVRFGEIEEPS